MHFTGTKSSCWSRIVYLGFIDKTLFVSKQMEKKGIRVNQRKTNILVSGANLDPLKKSYLERIPVQFILQGW